MRPLLFWTFYAFAKLKFAADFGFSWSLLVVIIWLVGLNPTFQKLFPISVRISDLYVRFALRLGSSEPDWKNFFEVFKGREETLLFSSFLMPSVVQGTVRAAAGRGRRRGGIAHAGTAPSTRGSTLTDGASPRWVLKHNFKIKTATNVNWNSTILIVPPSLGSFCPRFLGTKRRLITTSHLNEELGVGPGPVQK